MRGRVRACGGVWGRAAARSGAPDHAFQREHPRTRASWPQHQRLPLLLPPLLVGLLAPLVVVVVVAVATAVVVVLLIALVLAVLAALVSRYVQQVEEVAALHDLVVLRPAQLLRELNSAVAIWNGNSNVWKYDAVTLQHKRLQGVDRRRDAEVEPYRGLTRV